MRYVTLKGKYNNDCKIFLEQVDPGVVEMVQDLLDHPVSAGVPVRIMPDTHIGVGVVIGFTMPLTKMVDPRYIGVDIGCSVSSHKLSGKVDKKALPAIDQAVRAAVPTGFAARRGALRDHSWLDSYIALVNKELEEMRSAWIARGGERKREIEVDKAYLESLCRKVGIDSNLFYDSIGSLGGGNHFIELGEGDKSGAHYLTIHTGSRNFGLRVCEFHTRKMERGALLEGAALYHYLVDMVIAQAYAKTNHKAILDSIKRILSPLKVEESLHTMHNYIDWNDFIIRKGAISSYKDQMMAIPLNMRDGVLLCRGLGNRDWNYSAPHGAGRVLGRRQAKRKLDMDKFRREMEGVYSTSINKRTIDEAPMAYKEGEMIIERMADSAKVVERLVPFLSIKG